MPDPSSAESPLPWAAGTVAAQVADVLGQNYYAPAGDLADVSSEGPDEDDAHVVWAESAGSPTNIAVVVIEVDAERRQQGLRVVFGDDRPDRAGDLA